MSTDMRFMRWESDLEIKGWEENIYKIVILLCEDIYREEGENVECWKKQVRGRGGDPSTAHKQAALPKPNPSLIYFVNLANPNPTLSPRRREKPKPPLLTYPFPLHSSQTLNNSFSLKDGNLFSWELGGWHHKSTHSLLSLQGLFWLIISSLN